MKETKISKEEEVKKAVATLTDVSISMSSVELTQTAGGEIRPKIKVYNIDPVYAEKEAVAIMERLQKRFKVDK
ncbi:unnamed protein product [marine sediment metagenome]|uniref:Uncharacterized protein n=1 Tax=marine sediment metagenome TaxID=412755 RepID=X0SH47_9ZZZZ